MRTLMSKKCHDQITRLLFFIRLLNAVHLPPLKWLFTQFAFELVVNFLLLICTTSPKRRAESSCLVCRCCSLVEPIVCALFPTSNRSEQCDGATRWRHRLYAVTLKSRRHMQRHTHPGSLANDSQGAFQFAVLSDNVPESKWTWLSAAGDELFLWSVCF